jgi:hypothetical protein
MSQGSREQLLEMCNAAERQAQDARMRGQESVLLGDIHTLVFQARHLGHLGEALREVPDGDEIETLRLKITSGSPCDWFVGSHFAAFFATAGGWTVLVYMQLRKPLELNSRHFFAGVLAATGVVVMLSCSTAPWHAAAGFLSSALASISVAAWVKEKRQLWEAKLALVRHIRQRIEQVVNQQ